MLKKVEYKDTLKIKNYYKYVVDYTENMDRYGRWIYGLHPTDDMIERYISDGNMYFVEEETIIGAVAVTFYQDEDYHPVKWNVQAQDDEVSVIHILCIHPNKQGCGFAKKMMNEITNLAKEKHMKAVRLDALCCNTPAHRLYEDLGFIKCGIQNWYASNTGYIDFYLYELVLSY